MTISVTIDRRWGGFYAGRGYSLRLCLGFIAIDVFSESLELLLRKVVDRLPMEGED
jgi:hypothetical protein